ncbi:hypothetical protein T484DRAFT_1607707, partial [Baffinella frigidus]
VSTPKPQTPNPRPQTLNPEPETRKTKPETRIPNPETRNPKLLSAFARFPSAPHTPQQGKKLSQISSRQAFDLNAQEFPKSTKFTTQLVTSRRGRD